LSAFGILIGDVFHCPIGQWRSLLCPFNVDIPPKLKPFPQVTFNRLAFPKPISLTNV